MHASTTGTVWIMVPPPPNRTGSSIKWKILFSEGNSHWKLCCCVEFLGMQGWYITALRPLLCMCVCLACNNMLRLSRRWYHLPPYTHAPIYTRTIIYINKQGFAISGNPLLFKIGVEWCIHFFWRSLWTCQHYSILVRCVCGGPWN